MATKYKEFSQLNLPSISETILAKWQEEQAFAKSVELREGHAPFVFYEGPPSANGMPGIHHVISRTLKDLVCRYKTMQGFQVKRKGGWDTHGLPVELGVEKELGITKEDIGKKISVEDYNKKCREVVMRFKDKWDDITQKMGYWVDLQHPYITFENNYIETLWWCLSELYKKGYLYESVSIQPYSPAAGTGLSSHELNQPGTYKDVKDTSATVMFKLKDNGQLKIDNGGEAVYFMAWTTTPWTLPSNLGLTVGPNIEYVLVKSFNPYTHAPINVILAKNLIGKYFKAEGENGDFENYSAEVKLIPWEIVQSFTGKDFENLEYEQLLPSDANSLEKIQEITPGAQPFRIILGDFVTTEDGTGIVHTAPAFGADDFKVGKKNNLGILTLVDKQGKFVDGVGEFSGRYVKDYKNEANYVDVNVDISVKLKLDGKAFKIEKYEHNYPHCWRTDKPIIYYPLDAWFIKTTAVKERMVELNKTINWKPAATGTGRFGNWLENMVDWNLSRSRFWGTPLPIWKTEDGEEQICIGSISDLIAATDKAEKAGIPNKITSVQKNIQTGLVALKNAMINQTEICNGVFREDLGNIGLYFGKVGDVQNNYKSGYGLSHIIAKRFSENENGYDIVLKLIETIVVGKISKEVESKKTVHILHEAYEAVLSKDKFGEEEIWLLTGWKINKPDDSGEFSPTTTATHFTPTFSRDEVGAGLSETNIRKNISTDLLIDLHKPYVDDIVLISQTGKPMRRVPDLIDVWFDSGAMPYAQHHFPFENVEEFKKSFPADFIAEGVDQTRGWFYTLHALGVLLFDSVAYKTVVSNGLVLDKNGNKMSKRLGNVVDPFDTINKYGADATRWYLITNASPWDSLKFDANGIQEVQRKFFGTLYNTYQFLALYANVDGFSFSEKYIPVKDRPEIDQWILSSLNSLIKTVQQSMDDYEPTQAGRAIEEFVDEHLSNWYVRLCRRRFWKGEYEQDKICAYQTLYECLETMSLLIAPIAPFFADWLFLNLNEVSHRFDNQSVHHVLFPKVKEEVINADLENRMQLAQDASSLILSLRKKVNIKVRQPLQKVLIPALDDMMIKNIKDAAEIIKAETNIKEIEILSADNDFIRKKAKANFKTLGKKLGANMKFAADAISKFDNDKLGELEKGSITIFTMNNEPLTINREDVEVSTDEIPGFEVAGKGSLTVALDIMISDDLRNEGAAREFVNRIQTIRKETGFNLTDRIIVKYTANESIKNSINEYKTYICAEILADSLEFLPQISDGNTIEINETIVNVNVIKK